MTNSARLSPRCARRPFLRAAAGGMFVAALACAGCAGIGEPTTVSISESELTLLLARQFPLERKVLEVIDLQLANPQMHLEPAQNRIGTDLDIFALDRLFGSRTQGHIQLDYGLRFEASDHTIRLAHVHVRQLTMEAGSNTLHGTAQRIGTLVAEDLIENLPVYRMKPSQVDRMERLNLSAGPILVTSRGIQMAVGPKTP